MLWKLITRGFSLLRALYVTVFALAGISQATFGQTLVSTLLCENRPDPVGIDALVPRLSWQLSGSQSDLLQTAYEIRVGRAVSGKEVTQTIWESGKVDSDSSVQVTYKGPALSSAKRYYWQVRVWDNQGKKSDWSEPASWQMGMLQPSDWKAVWIEPGYPEDSTEPSPLMRKEFTITKPIRTATLYITAHGLYEARINGQKVGNAFFTPGWTSYHHRLQYQVYDIASQLHEGKNVLGAILGNGWYLGTMGYEGHNHIYGKQPGVLAQLDIQYSDGTGEQVVTDDSWKSSTGEIRSSEIYYGETINERMKKSGWDLPGYDDGLWSGVRVEEYSLNNLIATRDEPVTMHETFSPVKLILTPQGDQVLDFGQNLVGWVEVKVDGGTGDTLTIGHAEVLDKQGNFYTENLRTAKAVDTYILDGKGEQTLEPHFTFHGFRYIRVKGYPGQVRLSDFKAVALYTDMPATGDFSTSDPMINQLQHNIQWSQRGNFLDIPTDCPQRDERLGWTGDAQVFSRTASFNRNVDNFFAKWMQDVAADQDKNGSVPFVIPNILDTGVSSAGWADVATIIPWNMYLAYGDTRLLANQYQSMKAWVDYISSRAKDNLWNSGFDFGDWLFYRPQDDDDGRSAVTDKYLIAQCFYAHSTQLVIDAARVLGKSQDVNQYSALLGRIKAAFLREYVTPSGRLVSGTQTAYVLALNFDMLPDSLREEAVNRLVENIKNYNYHLTTGFLGTPYLCHVLTRFGHNDLACRLLLQKTYPSWLYEVSMGATTIWERWDGIRPDSSFENPEMNSFNHYAYGAIGDWMYRSLAGLDTYTDGPGYHHIRIMPHPDGSIRQVKASLETYYGPVSSSWSLDGNQVSMEVNIPANTTADIFVPSASTSEAAGGNADEMKMSGNSNGYTEFQVGSGHYHFTGQIHPAPMLGEK